MALLASELVRIKVELGFNALTLGAEPYIGVTQVFDQIIQPWLSAGAVTSTSTSVSGGNPAVQGSVTLASATGFLAGQLVFVDVDERQESLTLQSVVGSVATGLFKLPHSGTYPVTVDGGESIVRECLAHIRTVKQQMADTLGTGTLKKADEVEFYQGGVSQFGAYGRQLAFWRDELASCLNMPNLWAGKSGAGGGGQRIAVY